jgi:pimeloyl-ACP methyl ester carboxylesterase
MTRGMNAARKDRVNRVLSAVEAPVLIMRGPYDHISPDRWTRELAAAAPDGQAGTLPAGHT